MASVTRQRPAWLKKRDQTSQQSPTPAAQPPPKPSSSLDLFNRNRLVPSRKDEKNRNKEAYKERKRRRQERRDSERHGQRDSSSDGGDDEQQSESEKEEERPAKRRSLEKTEQASPILSSPEPVRYDNDGTPSTSPKKRRKVSLEDGSTVKQSIEVDSHHIGKAIQFSRSSGLPEKLAKQSAERSHQKPNVTSIELNDEPSDHTADDTDKEFERLARRAEERKQREKALKDPNRAESSLPRPASAPKKPNGNSSTPVSTMIPNGDARPTSTNPTSAPRASSSASADTSPILTILVHSDHMPNTQPIMFKTRLNQKLKMVKQAWCQRWGLTAEQSRDIYFKWRDFKIFDSTTCANLGVRIDEVSGEVFWKGKGNTEIAGSKELEFQAWTRELEEQEEKKKQQQAQAGMKESLATMSEERAPSEGAKRKIKVVVKAKGEDDWHLGVNDNTTFDRLARAFRTSKRVPESKSVTIFFDGEAMEPMKTIGEMDIEDAETLEAHVK